MSQSLFDVELIRPDCYEHSQKYVNAAYNDFYKQTLQNPEKSPLTESALCERTAVLFFICYRSITRWISSGAQKNYLEFKMRISVVYLIE